MDVLDEVIVPESIKHDPAISNLSRVPAGAKKYYGLFGGAILDVQVSNDDLVAEGLAALQVSRHVLRFRVNRTAKEKHVKLKEGEEP